MVCRRRLRADPGPSGCRVARVLAGKDNPQYTPFMDTGDHVIVINARKIKVTGMKGEQKVYRRYTGFPGGLREEDFKDRMKRKPELIVEEAINGMLPHSKLGRAMARKLKVYRGRQASARGPEAGSERLAAARVRNFAEGAGFWQLARKILRSCIAFS